MESHRPITWVLLRGLARESQHWGDFPAALQAKFPQSQVRCLEMPGTGEYYRESTPPSIPRLMEFLRTEKERRIPRQENSTLILIALSLGAMIAVEWLRRHSDDFAGVVLINPSFKGINPWYHRFSLGAYPRIFRGFLSSDLRTREKTILALTSQKAWDESELQKRIEIQKMRPVSRRNALRQIQAAFSYRPPKQLPEKPPVLLLNSLGDHLVHPDCSQALRDQWKLPLQRHAWAGHDLVLDDPTWVTEAIDTWWRGSASSSK